MAKNRQTNISLMEYYSRICKRYDLINRLFTFGLDKNWRKQITDSCLAGNPRNVFDLCCGTGDLALRISVQSHGNVPVAAYDLSRNMLGVAGLKAANLQAANIRFIRGDAAALPFGDAEFDCITIGFGFRNLIFENPLAMKHLQEISRVLQHQGKLLILESGAPQCRFIGFLHRLYLRLLVIPLGGTISGDWKAYKYLARSSANFFTMQEIQALFAQHSIGVDSFQKFLFGAANLIHARKLPMKKG